MTEKFTDHYNLAMELREQGELRDAGIVSVTGGYKRMGRLPHEEPPFGTEGEDIDFLYDGSVSGLYLFLFAGMDFKLAGLPHRSEFCARQGALISEELIETVDLDVASNFQASLDIEWWNYLGNFRAIAELNDVDEAFATAERLYREHGDMEFRFEQVHDNLQKYVSRLAVSAGHDVKASIFGSLPRPTYSDWAAFQREHVPEFVDTVVARGEWDL